MIELTRGVHDVWRGAAALAARPRLWKWLIAPCLVAVALLALAVFAIERVFEHVLAWASAHLPSWLAAIASPLLSAAVIAALIAAALLVFVAVAGAIAGPFLEILSERLEAELTGSSPAKFSAPRFVHELAVSLVHGIRRLIVALLGIAIVFAISLVPVVGTIAAVIAGVLFAARGAAYDCYDAVLARRALSYRDKLAYLAEHRGRTFGLGAVTAGLLIVPGINLIALGIGAAGATLACVERRAT